MGRVGAASPLPIAIGRLTGEFGIAQDVDKGVGSVAIVGPAWDADPAQSPPPLGIRATADSVAGTITLDEPGLYELDLSLTVAFLTTGQHVVGPRLWRNGIDPWPYAGGAQWFDTTGPNKVVMVLTPRVVMALEAGDVISAALAFTTSPDLTCSVLGGLLIVNRIPVRV